MTPPSSFRSGAIGLIGLVGLLTRCAPPPLICDCPAKSSCAAGRCVANGATPAINTARRLVFSPVDVAYVHRREGRGAAPPAGDPAVAMLGRGDDGMLLLRFDAAIPSAAHVLEAYLLLQRAVDDGEDPGLLALHAFRVVEPWSSASVTWAQQPRLVDDGAPITRVARWSSGFVRLEMQDIVRRWRQRGRDDFGVAVVVDGTTATGLGFLLLPTAMTAGGARSPAAGAAGPQLEVYVK